MRRIPTFALTVTLLFCILDAQAENCGPDFAESNLNELVRLSKELNAKTLPTLDPKFLKSWEPSARLPCKPPFKPTYRKNGKEVTFVATAHPDGPVKVQNSDFEFIKKAIVEFKPSNILIEMDTSGQVIPANAIRQFLVRNRCLHNDVFVCGEPLFAAMIGSENGVPVRGSETRLQVLFDE